MESSEMEADALTASILIESEPRKVWRALTTRRHEWWPEMEFEPVVGSPLLETWTEDGQVMQAEGRVTEVDPDKRLAFEWIEPGWVRPLCVAVDLSERGNGTDVTITEQGFVAAYTPEALVAEHHSGWLRHLRGLRDAVDH